MTVFNPRTWFGSTPIVNLSEGIVNTELMQAQTKRINILEDKYNRVVSEALRKGLTDKKWNSILGSIYTKTLEKKGEIIKKVDSVKNSFLYTAILDLVINDAIAPSVMTNDIVLITSSNAPIRKELQELETRIDFDALVLSLVEDLLSYGEYYTSIVSREKEGVIGIVDNVDQSEIVSVYDAFEPAYFLRQKGTKLTKIKVTELAHFCLGSRKLRIKVEDKDIKEYVRIGRPLFWGTFDLLRNLELISALIPASYLQKINSTSLIGIQVPDNASPEDAFEICRRYEDVLNSSISMDKETGDISISDVLSAAGKFKVIPVASSGKGTLTKMDPRFEEMTDISIFEELKRNIMATVGVPYEFVFGGDSTKGELLRRFARYMRKLYMTQQAIAQGIKQIAKIHLAMKGMKAAPGHIEVKFTNALISVEELDKIEFIDTLVGTLGNVVDVLGNAKESLGAQVDNKQLQEFLNRHLKIVGLEDLFKLTTKPVEPVEPVEPKESTYLERKKGEQSTSLSIPPEDRQELIDDLEQDEDCVEEEPEEEEPKKRKKKKIIKEGV